MLLNISRLLFGLFVFSVISVCACAQNLGFFSVDLGHSSFKVGTVKAGAKIDLVLNQQSKRFTHTLLAAEEGISYAGLEAFQRIGKPHVTSLRGADLLPWGESVTSFPHGVYSAPEDAISDLFRHIMNMIASTHSDEEEITPAAPNTKRYASFMAVVPPDISMEDRARLARGISASGATPIRFISAPAAALVQYMVSRTAKLATELEKPREYLIYDHGTSRATLSRLAVEYDAKTHEMRIRMKKAASSNLIGGGAVTKKLMDLVLERGKTKFSVISDLSERQMQRLEAAVETAKKRLTTNGEAMIFLEMFDGDSDLRAKVSTEDLDDFTEIIYNEVDRLRTAVLGIEKDEKNVDKPQVLIFGGASRLSQVRQVIDKLFIPDFSINADEAAALGAGLLAATHGSSIRARETFLIRDMFEEPVSVVLDEATEFQDSPEFDSDGKPIPEEDRFVPPLNVLETEAWKQGVNGRKTVDFGSAKGPFNFVWRTGETSLHCSVSGIAPAVDQVVADMTKRYEEQQKRLEEEEEKKEKKDKDKKKEKKKDKKEQKEESNYLIAHPNETNITYSIVGRIEYTSLGLPNPRPKVLVEVYGLQGDILVFGPERKPITASCDEAVITDSSAFPLSISAPTSSRNLTRRLAETESFYEWSAHLLHSMESATYRTRDLLFEIDDSEFELDMANGVDIEKLRDCDVDELSSIDEKLLLALVTNDNDKMVLKNLISENEGIIDDVMYATPCHLRVEYDQKVGKDDDEFEIVHFSLADDPIGLAKACYADQSAMLKEYFVSIHTTVEAILNKKRQLGFRGKTLSNTLDLFDMAEKAIETAENKHELLFEDCEAKFMEEAEQKFEEMQIMWDTYVSMYGDPREQTEDDEEVGGSSNDGGEEVDEAELVSNDETEEGKKSWLKKKFGSKKDDKKPKEKPTPPRLPPNSADELLNEIAPYRYCKTVQRKVSALATSTRNLSHGLKKAREELEQLVEHQSKLELDEAPIFTSEAIEELLEQLRGHLESFSRALKVVERIELAREKKEQAEKKEDEKENTEDGNSNGEDTVEDDEVKNESSTEEAGEDETESEEQKQDL